jgi:hypothetical protein
MKHYVGGIVFLASSAVLCAQGNSEGNAAMPEPPMLGIHWAHGASGNAPAGGQAGSSPLLTFHGGEIMNAATVKAIYWGGSWTNSTFVGDKISGLDTFYGGEGGSNYSKTTDEYTGSNGSIGNNLSYIGHQIDTTAAAKNGSRTAPILAEVCKVIGNSAVANGYYPVYVDQPRGHAGYCAWHSWGTCNGTNIQFAFFFNLDGDAGCDPGDTTSGHSQGLAALANVSGHELSEARTDPRGAGWFDSSGAENADKCAWTFGGKLLSFGGSSWKIQGNWSNAAYTAGTGYTRGCIDGN